MASGSDAAGIGVGAGAEKAVHCFFTPASKKPADAVKWSVRDGTLLCGRYDVDGEAQAQAQADGAGAGAEIRAAMERPVKIAAFDFV